jgi:hypothetical protein
MKDFGLVIRTGMTDGMFHHGASSVGSEQT